MAGPRAFERDSNDAIQSQAAILAATAARVRGDHHAMRAKSIAAHMSADVIAVDDVAGEFPIPQIEPAGIRVNTTEALDAASLHGAAIADRTVAAKSRIVIAERLYAQPNTRNAAALAVASLHHHDATVRVAAADLALSTLTESGEAMQVLANELISQDELVRTMAATSMARWNPAAPELRVLERPAGNRPNEPRSRTSMLVHGTFARTYDWWQPGYPGNFHEYLRARVWPDLYSAADRFDWSGGYSDAARLLGATQLTAWLNQRGLANGISLMTHSHGGSVAMLASCQTVVMNRLVLLSCPVHPAAYQVNFASVSRVVSIRVKLDLVLLLDGSGSRFSDPRYNEHVLPIWFDHTAPHDSSVWTQYNVPAML